MKASEKVLLPFPPKNPHGPLGSTGLPSRLLSLQKKGKTVKINRGEEITTMREGVGKEGLLGESEREAGALELNARTNICASMRLEYHSSELQVAGPG